MSFSLTKCTAPFTEITTITDLSAYVGRVVTLDKYVGCYLVGTSEKATTREVDVLSCYNDCEDCARKVYVLQDCTGRYPDIYSTDTRLDDKIDKIVKVPFYQDSCFLVLTEQFVSGLTINPYIEVSETHTTCLSCQTSYPVLPSTEEEMCETEHILEVKTKFSDMILQSIDAKRLGIKFCCPLDENVWDLRHNILEHELLEDPDPELPEPFVEECCLVIPNNSTCCCDENAIAVTEGCSCVASNNSPHDCHMYTVTITQQNIDLAVGNTEILKNGRVFFGYFKCKETNPTFVELTVAGITTYCVLGIPVLGYYAEDEWVELLTLARGAVCEPPVVNTCNHA